MLYIVLPEYLPVSYFTGISPGKLVLTKDQRVDQHIKTDPLDYLMSSEATSNEELSPSAAELYDKARELYASMVFWNMPVRRNMGG